MQLLIPLNLLRQAVQPPGTSGLGRRDRPWQSWFAV